MTVIKSLSLNGFRNYESASVDGVSAPFVILVGDNGAGKTNCLEGISLLSPGRGLRSASVADMQSQTHDQPWSVSAKIMDRDGDTIQMGVGRDPQKTDKKIIRADGTTLKNQDEIGEILRCVWLTPHMDGLFTQPTAERRRFFDRLVATYDPSHSGRMTRYEKATRERLNLLRDEAEKGKTADKLWLYSLENIMAETSVAIAVARMDLLDTLNKTIIKNANDDFPIVTLSLIGDVETSLKSGSALSVEDIIREKLSAFRVPDGQTGRTNFGIGRTDIRGTYTDKNVDAAQCSTGEQKALLTTVILAHACMVNARYGAPPILLFDEIAAHFDSRRRDALLDMLSILKGQVWLSGQGAQAFSHLKNKRIVRIEDNQLL
jgi:DNA replication and repair protein RecF